MAGQHAANKRVALVCSQCFHFLGGVELQLAWCRWASMCDGELSLVTCCCCALAFIHQACVQKFSNLSACTSYSNVITGVTNLSTSVPVVENLLSVLQAHLLMISRQWRPLHAKCQSCHTQGNGEARNRCAPLLICMIYKSTQALSQCLYFTVYQAACSFQHTLHLQTSSIRTPADC